MELKMINGPSVYDSGALGTSLPNLKPFLIGQQQQKSLYPSSCQNHIQPEKADLCRGHPNHIQRDHLSFFTVENQFLEGNFTLSSSVFRKRRFPRIPQYDRNESDVRITSTSPWQEQEVTTRRTWNYGIPRHKQRQRLISLNRDSCRAQVTMGVGVIQTPTDWIFGLFSLTFCNLY